MRKIVDFVGIYNENVIRNLEFDSGVEWIGAGKTGTRIRNWTEDEHPYNMGYVYMFHETLE